MRRCRLLQAVGRCFLRQLLRIARRRVIFLLLRQRRENLRAHIAQRLGMRRVLVFHLDDVEAILRAHQIRDLAHRHCEDRMVKRRHRHALLHPAQLAALVLAARVVGVLLRQLGKVLAVSLLQLIQHALRLRLGRGHRCRRSALRNLDQDVAHLHFFRNLVLVLVRVVVLLNLRVGHLRRAARNLRILERDVLNRPRLGNRLRIAARILLEIRLQLRVRGIDRLPQRVRIQHRVLEVDLQSLLQVILLHLLGRNSHRATHQAAQPVFHNRILHL